MIHSHFYLDSEPRWWELCSKPR